MARRTNQPALYELIRDPSMLTPSGAAAPGAASDAQSPPPEIRPGAHPAGQPAGHPAGQPATHPATQPVTRPAGAAPHAPLTTGSPPRASGPPSDPRSASGGGSMGSRATAPRVQVGDVQAPVVVGSPAARPSTGDSMGSAPRGTLGIHASVRVLRVPMGWVWIAAAIVVIALIASFSIGYRSGAARGERDRANELIQLVGDAEGRAGDPLTALSGGGVPGRGAAAQTPTTPAGSAREDDARRGGATESSAAPRGDPRVAGHSYFVVAHPLSERADELVAFLRAQGLDGAVIRERSSRFPKVIALPGFADPKSSAASDFRTRLRAAGVKWKAQARGNQDFGNAYLERFGS